MSNPFAHIELSTDDVANSKKFYKSVFAWKLADIPDMDYTMIDVGKGTGGGMMLKQSPEQPSAWLPYVEVDDVKKTIAKAQQNGAKIMLDYHEIGEMGAIGVFIDPSGAALGVWAQAKKAARKATPKKAAAKKPAKKAAPKATKKAGKKKK
jgi:predicted enzyme related to lactoylglutathione lyase